MSRGGAKRRFRVRRKRRGESVADVLDGGEAVAQFGCCLIEAVGAVSILIGLLALPMFQLIR